MADATIVRYEPCPECADGSCGKCGPASGEHAAPGVRLVVRQIRFVRCTCITASSRGCTRCTAGTHPHPLATPGVTIEIVDARTAKRWVPSMHLRVDDGPRCGGTAPYERLTTKREDVTCKPCIRAMKRRSP